MNVKNRSLGLALLLLVTLAACGGGSAEESASKTVTQKQLGDRWPLTIDAVVVGCPDGNRITVNDPKTGTTYWLNGLAKGDHAYADLNQIWADNTEVPGLKKDMGPLTEEATALCGLS